LLSTNGKSDCILYLAAIQVILEFIINKIGLVMLKLNLIAIVYIILFHFSSMAQTTEFFNSTEVGTNRGLVFEKDLDYRTEDSSYTDVIQLSNLGDKAQALQFRLLINKAADDSTILIFKDLQKGSDLSDPSWLLDFNVIKGQVMSNGASQDEILVVLYNLNQNGGLLPGDYSDLFDVNYEVAALPDLQNNIKSSIKISQAEASTFEGNSIDITSTRGEFEIYAERK